MSPENTILIEFADQIRPVQKQAQAIMAQSKRLLIAAGLTPEQASAKLAATLNALMREL